jgi:hypothetical protein
MFDIDLDKQPEQRWAEVAHHYRTEVIAMAKALPLSIKMRLSAAQISGFLELKHETEYEREMQGWVELMNDTAVTLDVVKQMNMLYEMTSPTACSGLLWAMQNGTVMHGRNMDYTFHVLMPDNTSINIWPNVTFQATFWKAGTPLYVSTHWPMMVGVATAMRFNGWSFEQNTRAAKQDIQKNLAAAQTGGKFFGTVVRKAMEVTTNFNNAVDIMSKAKFAAPQYFVMSGTGPFEGVVITIDRLGKHQTSTPPIMNISNTTDGWHLLQTNDDLNGPARDARRPTANYMLSEKTQDIISEDHLMEFMQSAPLATPFGTSYSTVMVPATGYYKTSLPDFEHYSIATALFPKMSTQASQPKLLEIVASDGDTAAGGLDSFLSKPARTARQRLFLSRHA